MWNWRVCLKTLRMKSKLTEDKRPRMFGVLRGTVHIKSGFDLTEPTGGLWAEIAPSNLLNAQVDNSGTAEPQS